MRLAQTRVLVASVERSVRDHVVRLNVGGVIQCVPGKKGVSRREIVIGSDRKIVLAGLARLVANENPQAPAGIARVRLRIQINVRGRGCARCQSCCIGRHKKPLSLREFLAQPLVGNEQKGSVSPHEAAYAAAELVSSKRWHALLIKEIAGVQSRVAQKFESAAMQEVSPRLAHQIDDAAACAAKFRTVIVRNQLKFLYRLDSREASRRGTRRRVLSLIHGGSIEEKTIEGDSTTIDRHLYGACPGIDGIFYQATHVDHSVLQRGQLKQVASIQRKLGNGALADQGGNLRVGSVYEGYFSGDGELLGDGSHVQAEIYNRITTESEHDATVRHFLELIVFRLDFVFTQRKFFDPEAAGAVRGHRAQRVGQNISYDDIRAGNRGAILVFDCTKDGAARALCQCRHRHDA